MVECMFCMYESLHLIFATTLHPPPKKKKIQSFLFFLDSNDFTHGNAIDTPKTWTFSFSGLKLIRAWKQIFEWKTLSVSKTVLQAWNFEFWICRIALEIFLNQMIFRVQRLAPGDCELFPKMRLCKVRVDRGCNTNFQAPFCFLPPTTQCYYPCFPGITYLAMDSETEKVRGLTDQHNSSRMCHGPDITTIHTAFF